jgi:sec-independent protein translocase protein TatC
MTKLAEHVAGARVAGSRAPQASRKADPEGRMPVMGHLRELRNRIIKAALAIGLGTVLGIVFFGPIWAVVTHPFCSAVISGHSGCKAQGDQLVVTGVFDPFMVRVQVAFFAGLIITSPVWLYQLWAFIAPGLYARERRWTYLFVGAAVPLFTGGAALAYLVMSRGLAYLLNLTPHGVTVLPTISTYLSYFQGMILGFGVTFELPLALIILNLARILTHARFRKWRRPMIFGAFLFAGIANPSPDPISMLLLAAPCVLLMEIAEIIVWANDRRRARVPDPYASLADDELAPLGVDDDPEVVPGGRSPS